MLIVCPSCASAFRIDPDKVGPEGRQVRCGACREPWFVSPGEVLAAQAEALGAAPAAPSAAAPADDEETSLAALFQSAAAAKPAAARPAPYAAPDASPDRLEAAEERADSPVLDNVPPAPRRAAKAKPRGKRAAGRPKTAAKRGLLGLTPATAVGLAVLACLPLACLARGPVVRAVPQTAGLYARIGLPVNLRGLELRDVVAFRNPAEADRPSELIVEGDVVGVARGDAPVPPIEVALRDAGGRVVATYPVPAPRALLAEAETARFRARFSDPPASARAVDLRFADAGRPEAADGHSPAAGHGARQADSHAKEASAKEPTKEPARPGARGPHAAPSASSAPGH